MRLSELLGLPVFDDGGTELGPVREVVLAARPTRGKKEFTRLEIEGLIVGKDSMAIHWGYDGTRHQGPWLLRKALARRQRRARYVPWSIATLDKGVVRLSRPSAELQSPDERLSS